jgi:hypothetical protein
MRRGLASLALVWVVAVPAQAAPADDHSVFYFPTSTACTMMMDFQKARQRLASLDREARAVELTRAMIQEFARNGAAKCPTQSQVQLLAVYIPGTDNYGRPDFGRRVNALKVAGSRTAVNKIAGSAAKPMTLSQIRQELSVELY